MNTTSSKIDINVDRRKKLRSSLSESEKARAPYIFEKNKSDTLKKNAMLRHYFNSSLERAYSSSEEADSLSLS